MIRIIAVGKCKEDYSRNAAADYLSRIRRYSKIEVIEVKESDIEREGAKIYDLIDGKRYHVLDIYGKQLGSEDFAQFVKKETFNSDFVFVIGGSEGISEDIKKNATNRLSISQMTFTHEMCRVFILEQLYRAFMILNNKRYHK